MAYIGHVKSNGKIVLNNDILTGRTRIRSISTLSDLSVRSVSPEFMSPKSWEFSSAYDTRRMLYKKNMLYREQTESASSSSTPLSLPPAKSGSFRHMNNRSDSVYSWSEIYGPFNQTDSNMIPSLDLNSNPGSAIDYMRDLGDLKLDREPQVAYENWYAAKQILRQQKLQREKEEEMHKAAEKLKRKQMAKFCYEEWLRSKSQQASQRRNQDDESTVRPHTGSTTASNSRSASGSSSRSGSSGSGCRPVRNIPQTEIRRVVQSWWHKKQEQQQRQRLEREMSQKKKAREEKSRKELAEKAWENWMTTVYEKPKPVPMNQGVDSLRGTISEQYLNPMPWQQLNPSKRQEQ